MRGIYFGIVCQVFRWRCLSISRNIQSGEGTSAARTSLGKIEAEENSSSPQHRDVSRSLGSLGFIYIINRLKPHGCVLKSNLEIPPFWSPTLLPSRGEGRRRLARAITLHYSHARFLPLSDTWENLVEHPPPKFQRYPTILSLFLSVSLSFGFFIAPLSERAVARNATIFSRNDRDIVGYRWNGVFNLLRGNDVPRMSRIFCPKMATFSQF